LWAHFSFQGLRIRHSQRRAHARPVFTALKSRFKGVPLVAASQPLRRANAPHLQYRGYPSIICAHTSRWSLGIRHSQRRAHARPVLPPSRAHSRGCPLWRFRSRVSVPTRPTVDTAAILRPCVHALAVGGLGSCIISVGRTHGRCFCPQEPFSRGCR